MRDILGIFPISEHNSIIQALVYKEYRTRVVLFNANDRQKHILFLSFTTLCKVRKDRG